MLRFGEKRGHFIGRDDAFFNRAGGTKESLYSEPQPELLKALSEVSTGTAQSTQLSEDLRFVDQKKNTESFNKRVSQSGIVTLV